QSSLCGNVSERSVVVIVVKGERRPGRATRRFAWPVFTVDQYDIEPAIAVVIDEGAAGAKCLRIVELPRCPAHVLKGDPGRTRHVRECNLRFSLRLRNGT